MKALIIISLFATQIAFSQTITFVYDTVYSYQKNEQVIGLKTLEIPVDFDDFQLKNEVPDSLNNLAITKIDLVYTTYKTNPDFDQIKLNNNRINKFINAFAAADNQLIDWRTVGQTQALTKEEAQEMFHGFVIYYRPTPTVESIEEEIDFMDDFLGYTDAGEPIVEEAVAVEEVKDDTSTTTKGKAVYSEYYVSSGSKDVSGETAFIGLKTYWNPYPPEFVTNTRKIHGDLKLNAFYKGDSFGKYECFEVRHHYIKGDRKDAQAYMDKIKEEDNYYWVWGIYKKTETADRDYLISYYYGLDSCESSDSASTLAIYTTGSVVMSSWANAKEYGVVQQVFERNPDWQNTLVVMDVTGSMSPYIANTMKWVKATQDSSQVQAFVFFNDGNNTPDRLKITGSVGGVYGSRNNSFDDVYQTMKSTMRKGGGGDCPENNIEASIKGADDYPDTDELIMVADNWATPRDLKLVKKLKKPVHVILCGASSGINMQYIQLAIDTGGSVHTIEEDLNARDIKPGESYKLGRYYFTVIDGKVVTAENK